MTVGEAQWRALSDATLMKNAQGQIDVFIIARCFPHSSKRSTERDPVNSSM